MALRTKELTGLEFGEFLEQRARCSLSICRMGIALSVGGARPRKNTLGAGIILTMFRLVAAFWGFS
jgi:hypothetical protein